MKNIIIAIDGHSSCGKSTFAKLIAKRYCYKYIDTGAMYRAVTLFAIENGFLNSGILDEKALIASLGDIHFDFANDTNDISLNGKDVEKQIRSMEVSSFVSRVSEVGAVREALVEKQKDMGKGKGIVMGGRDIGTAVFPDAELKIFMTASVGVRAQRRYKEYIGKGVNASLKDIQANISERDALDENRKISPLRKADDAILLDNSDMTIEQQMMWVEDMINKKGLS
ncbi:MAG: (d)CMP kinase [Rikenellaceae bacterium]